MPTWAISSNNRPLRSTRRGPNRSCQRPTSGPSTAIVAGTANSIIPAAEIDTDCPTR